MTLVEIPALAISSTDCRDARRARAHPSATWCPRAWRPHRQARPLRRPLRRDGTAVTRRPAPSVPVAVTTAVIVVVVVAVASVLAAVLLVAGPGRDRRPSAGDGVASSRRRCRAMPLVEQRQVTVLLTVRDADRPR